MKVVVIGAGGPLGLAVLRRSIVENHTVTAIARRPDSFEKIDGVTSAAGDVLNLAFLEAALTDQDCVICVLGTPWSRKATTLLSEGTRNIMEAMKRNDVRRLVCVTGIGAGDSRGHGGWLYDHIIQPFLLNEIYRDKTRQEAVIRASDRQWVIVRPAQLTNGPATGRYRVATDLTGVVAKTISRADVAEFLVRQLVSDEYLGMTPVLTY